MKTRWYVFVAISMIVFLSGCRRDAWSLGEVNVSTKIGSWENTSPFEKNLGGARFTVNPDAGEELVSVRFSITALVADTEAVAKLTARREALAKTIPVFGLALLIDAKKKEALTGTYRMFDIQDLTLVIQKVERSPCWVVGATAPSCLVASGNITSSSGECDAPWHLAYQTSTSFTGLLEVGKPVTITLLFSVPKGSDMKSASLSITGQNFVPVKITENNRS